MPIGEERLLQGVSVLACEVGVAENKDILQIYSNGELLKLEKIPLRIDLVIC